MFCTECGNIMVRKIVDGKIVYVCVKCDHTVTATWEMREQEVRETYASR